jgi:hypothetical protein
MPRIGVTTDICLRRPRPTYGCRADYYYYYYLLTTRAFWDVTLCCWVDVSRCLDLMKVFLKPSVLEENAAFFGNAGRHRVTPQKTLIFNVMVLFIVIFSRSLR